MTLPIPHVPPHADISEADFQRVLYQALNAPTRLTRVWRQNAGAVTTRNRAGKPTGRFQGAITGAADLSGLDGSPDPRTRLPRGRRLEIEVKVDHDWTEAQQVFAAQIMKMGGLYVIVRYGHSLTLSENVERGIAKVDAAISAEIPPAPVDVRLDNVP